MSKTYSAAFQNKDGVWLTNWYEYDSLDDIDWRKVEDQCHISGYLAYGYYYGHRSSQLKSAKCRTVVKELRTLEIARKLWVELGDLPINEAEEIELPFLHFEANTHRETIWHWFEERFNVYIDGKMELQQMPYEKVQKQEGSETQASAMA